jgi:hypothetical protein
MVCLDSVGTLNNSTIEVPFNLKEKITDYRLKYCNEYNNMILCATDAGMTTVLIFDNLIIQIKAKILIQDHKLPSL